MNTWWDSDTHQVSLPLWAYWWVEAIRAVKAVVVMTHDDRLVVGELLCRAVVTRSSNVAVLRATTQGILYLNDTRELDVFGCLSCFLFCFVLVFLLVCYTTHDLHDFLCPNCGSVLCCASLQQFAMCSKAILLWHRLFEAPGLCCFIILFFPTRGKYLFVCLFLNLLCYVSISSQLLNIIKFLGLHPHNIFLFLTWHGFWPTHTHAHAHKHGNSLKKRTQGSELCSVISPVTFHATIVFMKYESRPSCGFSV